MLAYQLHILDNSLSQSEPVRYASHIIDVVCGLGTSCGIYLGLTRVR